jgi:dTDP-4-amino-4,6-dideoxygalactose transaminase
MEIAREHNLKVIEDCAQADGTSYKGRRVGSIGDCGCFSLDYYKIITSGEGGFMTTNDEFTYVRAQSYHDTAACWRPDRYARERMPGELFCGENYRMSELQGAVALAQIRRMDKKMSAWRRNKKRIIAGIEKLPGLGFQRVPDPDGEAGFSLTMLYPTAELAVKAIEALVAEGVPAGGRKDRTVRDWHIYSYWEHILEQKTPTPEGCPFTCHVRFGGRLPEYSPDMCPKTIDYLHRSVRVSIGENYTKEECDSIALGINKVNEALLGRGQSN